MSIPFTMAGSLEQPRASLHQPLAVPRPELMHQEGAEALAWLIDHWQQLPHQPVGQSATRSHLDALLRQPPPEEGRDFTRVLDELSDKVFPYAMRLNHPRFLAFIPSAPSFASVLAELLCAGTNFFCGVWVEAAGPAEIEVLVLDWFRQWLDMPPETRGVLTSGGSEANLTALVAARDTLPLEDRPRAVLYLCKQRHGSVDRAARIMGMHVEQLRIVPTDPSFRMDVESLKEQVRRDRRDGRMPWAVVANAGATNTGTVDPLSALADICREERLWFHVDAAYGWPAVLIPEGKAALEGIGHADSVTLDPHKWFAQPFESGCVLVRDGRRLLSSFGIRPDYMQDVGAIGAEVHFADHGLSLTRRFRALKIWMSIQVHGLSWFRELIDRCCRLAELAQLLLEATDDFEILCPRQLSIICFRYRPAEADAARNEERLDRLNLALVEELRLSGRAFISSTRLRGRVALRFCFVNWRTTAADVEQVVKLLADVGQRLSKHQQRRS